ncbi:MAG: hypothetical protein ACUVWJ_11385 [Spirochaetota bacterium]
MPFSAGLIEDIEKLDPKLRVVFIDLLKEIERDREESISRKEFLEFAKRSMEESVSKKEFYEFAERTEKNFQRVWEAIEALTYGQKELVEAQKRTEQRLEALVMSQKELVEAQKRIEQRLEALTEAQEHTEQRLQELAEAQKHTEQRLQELAEAQKHTEQRLQELAEAQERTEQRLQELAESHNRLILEHRETRRQLGGLAQAWGYTLENESYKALPGILEKNHGVKLKEKLKRGFLTVTKGQKIEVNIIGRGQVGEKEVLIIGECKSQLSKNDIDNFIRRKLERIKEVVDVEVFPVVVTHMISLDDVEDYARQKGLLVYYSYDFI